MQHPTAEISFSIVSHGQASLIKNLLLDFNKIEKKNFEVLITLNLDESIDLYSSDINYNFPIHFIKNKKPKGFGSNHNAAFELSRAKFFSVVNPDIRLLSLNINSSLELFSKENTGAVAPIVFNPSGDLEDSARFFPTFFSLLKRKLFKTSRNDYSFDTREITVDWAAGMFLIFESATFRKIKGFDEKRFFMYFEDVDICKRLWDSGYRVYVNPRSKVMHDARRESHSNLKYLRWHITSAIRYLLNI